MFPPSGAHCLARLYLRAVLPALATYVARDESARTAAEGPPFAVRFASTSGVATTLAIGHGAIVIDPPAAGFALRLLFLSDRALVRAFRRQGLPLALPWGGLHHLVRLRPLMALLAGMEGVLNTPAEESSRGGRRELRVALLLGEVLPAAVAELGVHDRECRRLLAPFGDFVAQLSVAQVSEGWIRRRGARMQWGRGPGSRSSRMCGSDSGIRMSRSRLWTASWTVSPRPWPARSRYAAWFRSPMRSGSSWRRCPTAWVRTRCERATPG